MLGTSAVLARPFHVVGVVARAGDLRDHHLVDLLRLLLELVFHVHRRRGQEGVDAAALGGLDRLGATVDVLERGARQSANDRVLRALGDLIHRGEVALRCDRKTGLDDVDAHLVEQLGDFELFLVGHGGARTLFAVAQGGVEDDDAVLLGLRWGVHTWSFSSVGALSVRAPARFRAKGLPVSHRKTRHLKRWSAQTGFPLLLSALWFRPSVPPERPGVNAQPALRGG